MVEKRIIDRKYLTASWLIAIVFGLSNLVAAQVDQINDPMTVAKRIADKLVRETPFKYRLKLATDEEIFKGIHMLDFGANFKLSSKSTAYAYTQMNAREDMDLEIQIGHNDECSVWVNGSLAYERVQNQELELVYDERSIELPYSFSVALKKGINTVLIKSASYRDDWRIYLQPPSDKGAVSTKTISYPEIGLQYMKLVDEKVAELSNWLIVGPFDGDVNVLSQSGEPVFGQMFEGQNGPISWTIPRVEVVGDFIDSRPWGTNYHWNYHNGGVAWAMKTLGEITGEDGYEKYADNFCDFQMSSIPFINYETETLGKMNVPNGLLINTPLLDFTLAPSIPFIYRLTKDKSFNNRSDYVKFIDEMLEYAKNEQIRLPDYSNYTRTTPQKYTTWVDDMFMGIPFLVQAALYSSDEKRVYFDDASNQVLDFNKHVWDESANLYVHARYSSTDEKMIHWSRANGWGIWAVSEVLLHLPKEHPNYKKILKHYQTHVKSLIRFQDEKGFWHNVLDYPESRQEVSGTAIFTMAIARGVAEGWLIGEKYKQAARNGWGAIASQVESDGTVHNICYGTMCSSDVNYYLNRPFYDNDTHGLFAVLFAAIEVSKMNQEMK